VKQSQHFLDNAENCTQFAERAKDEPPYKRYKRMEAASRAGLAGWRDRVALRPPIGGAPKN
jgi:hypothetical protein